MRLRRITIVIVALVPLVSVAACGGATATLTALPSAGALPRVATPEPTRTVAAPDTPQRADATVSPAPRPAGTPTALGTSAGITTVRATSAPTVATPAATVSTPRPTQPAATATPGAKVERIADIPSGAPQQVIGTAGDGLTLLNLRAGKNEGFTRIVFDVSKQDGSAAPVPRTRVWMQGSTVIVAFGGVRDDVYAQSLGGAEQPVNLGMVQSVYRIPVRDDTETAYGIALSGPTRVTLSSTTLPTRVIIDIADK